MTARVGADAARRISKEQLRLETSEILHGVYKGAVKMVAANRPPKGVSASRIYREAEGLDANRLELLCEDLDRTVIEKGAEAVLPVLAFLNARYRGGPARGDGIDDEVGAIAERAGTLVRQALHFRRDGLDATERRALHELSQTLRRELDAFEAEVDHPNGAGPH